MTVNMNRENEEREGYLRERLLDFLDAYGYNINGFQKAMKQMIREEELTPAEWQMLQHYTARDLL